MTRKEARKKIERNLSIGWHEDGKPRSEGDIAILIAIKALDNMIYLEEQMGEKDKEIEL
jgi:hypothetical protein